MDEALRDRVVAELIAAGVAAEHITLETRYRLATVCVGGRSIVAFADAPTRGASSLYVMSPALVASLGGKAIGGSGGTIRYREPLSDELVAAVVRGRMGEVLGVGGPGGDPQRVPDDPERWEQFETRIVKVGSRVVVPVPFDADRRWGAKRIHHVVGSVQGIAIRGRIEPVGPGGSPAVSLGVAWLRDGAVALGDTVTVHIAPEGPQQSDLAPDIAAALAGAPSAQAAFDALAQFYRRDFVRWIEATTRRPEERARRIAEMVERLERGEKQRPR